MVRNKLNKSSYKFKERIPMILKAALIIPALFVTLPFLLIVFLNPANFWFLPFALGWCVLVFLNLFYRFNIVSKVILTDKRIIVPNRGNHRHVSDVSGSVIIRNGLIMIPYEELLDITVKERNIYLTYKGLSNCVVLDITNEEKFISILNTKLLTLGINIPINIETNNTKVSDFLLYSNNTLKNTPTIIIFIIFFTFPNFVGFYNIFSGNLNDSLIFTVLTALVTIMFFTVIFMYKDILILSDEGIIESTKIGDIDLGDKKILYTDIVKIKETNWRVDIRLKSKGYIYFVPTNKKDFCLELCKRVGKNR